MHLNRITYDMPCRGLGCDLGMHHAGVLGLLLNAHHEVQIKLRPSKSHLRHQVTPMLYLLLVVWWRRSLTGVFTHEAE